MVAIQTMKGSSIIMTPITKVLEFNPEESEGNWTDELNTLIQRERMNSNNVLVGIERSLDGNAYILMFTHVVPHQNGYQSKQLNENSNRATSKQINYIKSLAKNNNEVLTNVEFDKLTKAQAGQLIHKLKQDSNTKKQDYQQERLPGFDMNQLEGMFDN